ncbi:MAG: hypothetical protein L0Z55_11525, partial [Planctomycetes bacterium]|nr:hypothetical protein [Planctomycetota bacterium]
MQKRVLAAAAALILASPLANAPADAEEPIAAAEPGATASPTASPTRGYVIADFPTKYYWRGFPEEDDGFIFQPWANLIVPVFQRSGSTGLTELALNFGS